MIRLSVNMFCGALLALLLSGCNVTFQSSQFNFVKGLFAQESPLPEKNWQVRWQGKTYPVFAVNHDGGTFFADEHGFLVSFDGWQIRQVSISRSKDEKIAVIEKTTSDDGTISLDYRDGNSRRLARDNCQAWVRTTGTGWAQDCKSAKKSGANAVASDAGYTNTIELNMNGELVALRFMVLPGADLMQIRLQQQPPLAGSDQDRKSQYE
jgi:hypothetical protein